MPETPLPTSYSPTDLTHIATRLGLPARTWETPSAAGYAFADHAVRSLAPAGLHALAKKHPALAPLAAEAEKLRALPTVSRTTLQQASTHARLAHREAGLLRWDAEEYLSWRRDNVYPDATAAQNLTKAEQTLTRSLLAYQILVLAREALRTAGYSDWSPVRYEPHYARRAAALCADLHDLVRPLLQDAS